MPFTKSDIGAQSAWKGYSSQTLYIASRIMGETANDEYYPEHLEDLLIKRDGQVVEAVQVKNLSDPLTISDLANPAATAFYGYLKEELLNMFIQDINVLPKEEVEKRRLEALKKKRKYNLFPHRLKNGLIRLVDVYTCTIIHKGDTKLYSIIFDATDRERYKEELFQEKEYLNSLIRYANAPIIILTIDLKIAEFNQAFEKLTGRSRENVIGQGFEILIPSDKKEAAMDYIKNLRITGYIDGVEFPVLHLSGAERTILWNSATIKNSNGESVAIFAQGIDITERKRAENELRYISNHDYLTGVYNRRFFEDELKRLDISRNLPITIVMGDLNGLKLINDSCISESKL
ncbi:MAG: PAS domain S-box protein [Peptococcaceae bacterium]|nr:PAS domain S-box protein [Peptococcaceae bacterium]